MMKRYSKKHVLWIGALLALTILALWPDKMGSEQGGLVVEGLLSEKHPGDLQVGETQLYLLPKGSAREAVCLTEGLYSAKSPSLFHDATRIVFSAKTDQSSHWQLFAYDLEQEDYAQLFEMDRNCFYPVYLPSGEILFSSPVEIAPGTVDLALFKWKGNEPPQRITFTPYSFTQPLIMKDGRILARYADSPESASRSLMVMRPDGTKNALFYQSPEGNVILGDLLQRDNGSIVFLEYNKTDQTTELVSIAYNHPSNSREVMHRFQADKHVALSAGEQGKLILTVQGRSEKEGKWFVLDLQTKTLEPFMPEGIRAKEIKGLFGPGIYLASKERQKILPSAVKPEEHTALLMCQDTRITGKDQQVAGDAGQGPLEVQGLERVLGRVDPEPDGSFYLKLAADIPFRFQRLDQRGEPLGEPSAWISLRPNERRACIGCHVSNERVPENVQPLAVQKEPLDLTAMERKIMAKSMN